MLRLIAHSLAGRLDDFPEIESFDFETLDVTPRRTGRHRLVKVATDGEVTRLKVPLSIRVSPVPLALLTPAAEDAAPRA